MQGCNKKFAQSTNLKSHILTHAKQKSGRGSVSSPDSGHALDSAHHGLDSGVSVLSEVRFEQSCDNRGVTVFTFQPQLVQVEVSNPDEQFIVYTE